MNQEATELFLKVVNDQDKFDIPTAEDRCDRCGQQAVAKMFFEPRPDIPLPTVMFCSQDLREHANALSQQDITGGYIDLPKIWWLDMEAPVR